MSDRAYRSVAIVPDKRCSVVHKFIANPEGARSAAGLGIVLNPKGARLGCGIVGNAGSGAGGRSMAYQVEDKARSKDRGEEGGKPVFEQARR